AHVRWRVLFPSVHSHDRQRLCQLTPWEFCGGARAKPNPIDHPPSSVLDPHEYTGQLTMPFAVAVDIGGTFTDLVAYDDDSRTVAYAKSPTTYGNLVTGVLDCFAKARLHPRAAHFVNHGTTLVINSLIQRNGAKAALVTTAGFRDILEIARGN